MDEQDILTEFGKELMSYRDWSLDGFEWAATGTTEHWRNTPRHRTLSSLPAEHLEIVREEVRRATDSMLHYVLFMFEQHDGGFDVVWDDPETGETRRFVEHSDGLGGEIFSEEGWIARFSKHPQVAP